MYAPVQTCMEAIHQVVWSEEDQEHGRSHHPDGCLTKVAKHANSKQEYPTQNQSTGSSMQGGTVLTRVNNPIFILILLISFQAVMCTNSRKRL